MRANRTDHCLFPVASLDRASSEERTDPDAVSFSSLNMEANTGLHYLPAHPAHRRPAHKRLTSSVPHCHDSVEHGQRIAGALFDGHLFQPSRSSYILDYTNTPKDLNRFIEGHDITSNSSHLDPHLFKLAFVLTLSEWNRDKELLLDYCPHEDSNERLMEAMIPYKQFCFPELNSRQKDGGTLVHDQSTYVFTRTLSNGHVEYGYCRRIMNSPTQTSRFPIVICIGKIWKVA